MFTVNQDHSFGFSLCIHAKRKLVLFKYERLEVWTGREEEREGGREGWWGSGSYNQHKICVSTCSFTLIDYINAGRSTQNGKKSLSRTKFHPWAGAATTFA
jgi:hypothetical protein